MAHAAFGYARRNVRFLKGYIEKLGELGLTPGSFDVIVSNCVINLSVDKLAVLRGAFDLLKPGGELYFADVYCDRRLSDSVRSDPVLYGECLGGALYWNDFLPMAKQAGFLDPRLVTSRAIDVENEAMRAKLGQAKFFSATYRLFKLDGLETACEDYGQAVIYKGTLPRSRTRSSSTGIISSSAARCSRSAATPGACSPTRALRRISISSAISRRITGSSPAAARRSPSPRRRRRQQSPAAAAVADTERGGGEGMQFDLTRRLTAEALGTLILVMAVVGSGIMAEKLAGGNQAIALLCNTLATGAVLFVIITIFAPISGAHFNPAVSLVMLLRGALDLRRPPPISPCRSSAAAWARCWRI